MIALREGEERGGGIFFAACFNFKALAITRTPPPYIRIRTGCTRPFAHGVCRYDVTVVQIGLESTWLLVGRYVGPSLGSLRVHRKRYDAQWSLKRETNTEYVIVDFFYTGH